MIETMYSSDLQVIIIIKMIFVNNKEKIRSRFW